MPGPPPALSRRALASRTPGQARSRARAATGRTPIALYQELVALTAARGLDWSTATTFNLDEFVGIAPGRSRLLPPVHGGAPLQPHQPRPRPDQLSRSARADPDEECLRYERAIAEAGGIDIQILGIGTNGHIGFNEPGAELQARTHRVTLRPETRRSNAALFGGDIDRGAGRGAVDGNGDDPSGASDRAAGARREQGGAASQRLVQRTDHDRAAGVVPAAAPRRRI